MWNILPLGYPPGMFVKTKRLPERIWTANVFSVDPTGWCYVCVFNLILWWNWVNAHGTFSWVHIKFYVWKKIIFCHFKFCRDRWNDFRQNWFGGFKYQFLVSPHKRGSSIIGSRFKVGSNCEKTRKIANGHSNYSRICSFGKIQEQFLHHRWSFLRSSKLLQVITDFFFA